MDQIRLQHRRERVLARAARRLPPLESADKQAQQQKRFVEHLAQIAVDEEQVDKAIEDYLRFGTEQFRLMNDGEVLNLHWDEPADRLQDRWQAIQHRVRRRCRGGSAEDVGQEILGDTLDPDYREPLGGEAQPEPYFTRGHYHRIADEDGVWWYPCGTPHY